MAKPQTQKPTGWSYYRQMEATVKPDDGDAVRRCGWFV